MPRSVRLKNWYNNSHMWGTWARTHSPLLMQHATTNALESYHRKIKSELPRNQGLIGVVKHLHKVHTILKLELIRKKELAKFKSLHEIKESPFIKKLPLLLQKKLFDELKQARVMAEEDADNDPPQSDNAGR